jgi:dolichol kinase
MEFRAHAQPAYESLAACLRDQGTHVPSLRPTNYTRNVFHVLNAVWVLLLVQVVLVPTGTLLWVALGGAIWAWSMEIARRRSPAINVLLMRVFRRVAHPHEAHRINSATWYATALVVLASLFEVRAGVIGLAILGIGDPLAAVVGRRFGSIRLIHGRSLQGTLAFVAGGTVAGVVAQQIWYPGPLPRMLALAAAGALVGGVAELLAKRIDDNLAIPVASAAGVTLAAWLLAGLA